MLSGLEINRFQVVFLHNSSVYNDIKTIHLVNIVANHQVNIILVASKVHLDIRLEFNVR